jgi:hypothetical protein
MTPTTVTARPAPVPWYREPYVWLVILFPAMAVVAGFITLRLAIVSDDGLVIDDYYKAGLHINRVLDRDRRAAALGLKANVQINPDNKTIRVLISSHDGVKLPDKLSMRLMHATRAGFDRTVILKAAGDGSYRSAMPPMALGHWYAQIEYADWRILDSFFLSPR